MMDVVIFAILASVIVFNTIMICRQHRAFVELIEKLREDQDVSLMSEAAIPSGLHSESWRDKVL